MIYGLYLSTLGTLIQDTKSDVVANNLANSNTVGFKPDMVAFRVRPAEPDEDVSVRSEGAELLVEIGGGAFIAEVVTKMEQGQLKQTGEALDIALDGEGFFAVTDGTKKFYTRAGNLMVQDGYLMTQTGMRVVDETGRPISVGVGEVSIGSDGTVFENADPVGRLLLVRASVPRAMRKVGDTLFVMSPAAREVASDAEVRVGYLEASGMNPMAGIAEMIEAMRMYEANMQAIRLQDTTLDHAVNEVGRITA